MTNSKLIFSMNLGYSENLITGNLALDYGNGQIINYLATSGARGRQTKELLWEQGKLGALPEGEYSIPTIGYVSNVPGIQGYFFHIQPDPISEKGRRSQLGIHHDANAPGTAGCIGIIRRDSFDKFCDRLEELNGQGIKRLSLIVQYSK